MESEEHGKRYWIALAVENSMPRPEPDPDSGFWPMYCTLALSLYRTTRVVDALCVFSTDAKAISYLREAERRAPITGASGWPLDHYFEDSGRLLDSYDAYVTVDPGHDVLENVLVPVEEFLTELED